MKTTARGNSISNLAEPAPLRLFEKDVGPPSMEPNVNLPERDKDNAIT